MENWFKNSGIIRYPWLIVHVVLLIAIFCSGWFVTDYLSSKAKREMKKENEAAVILLTTALTGDLRSVETGVKTLAEEPPIFNALASPTTRNIEQANSVLDRFNSSMEVSVSYLVDAKGMTIASSNRHDADSFVGHSYSFRPYFSQAMKGFLSRYFALGTVSQKRSFYAGYPVLGSGNRITGVTVMKKNLDAFEHQLNNYGHCFFIDRHGIIFLSGKPDMIFKALWPIDRTTEQELISAKQFGEQRFTPILSHEVLDGMQLSMHGEDYLVSRKFVGPEAWSIVLVSPAGRISLYRTAGLTVTAMLCLLVMMSLAATFHNVRQLAVIRKNEERFQQVAQSSQDWIWELDVDGRYTYSSQGIRQILGYEPEEIMRKYYFDFYFPEDKENIKETVKSTFAKQEAFFRLITKRVHNTGRLIFLETTGFPMFNDAGEMVGYRGVNRDISARIEIEEALSKNEKKYRELVENANSIILRMDSEGTVTFFNEFAQRFFGYSEAEIVGKNVVGTIVPEQGSTGRDLKSMIRHIALHPELYSNNTNENIRRNGDRVWIAWTSKPITDERGQVIGILCIGNDVTELKKAEEEKENLEKRLLQAQKMEAIGTLAGGIAHDFNNLLTGILGYTSLMLYAMDESQPNYRKLKNIEEQARRGADLTAQLLGFARGGRYETKPTSLNNLLGNSAAMFGRTKKDITIHAKYQKDLWSVEVDRGQIEQVLLNLFLNAWQVMPDGGEIYLETDNVILDQKYVQHYSVPSTRYVKISVTDTGTGMDEQTQERIFEPFFTTKEMGRGTGLGLAMVYGIIKGHKGLINVYSELGHGTTFSIYLPASGKDVTDEMVANEELEWGDETILIVDDEEVVINVAKDILESLGYEVLIAHNGHEAIDIYKANNDKIHLVILDMVMPEMSGGETFDRLKEINPNINVILASGYSLNGMAKKIIEKGCRGIIQKPFTIVSLSHNVREALDEDVVLQI
jgi:PAS domain S-box-containing protein